MHSTHVSVANGATLGGSGSVSGNVSVSSGGTLSPGSGTSTGVLTINGNLDMQSGSTLAVQINGTTAGTGHDQVIVNGAVNVSGAALSVAHGYAPGQGDSYVLIANDDADAVTGTFSGMAQGGTLTADGNGTVLTASYVGGTGNDLTLTAPINAAPVVTTSGGGAAFIEGANVVSTPVAVDSGITLSDVDNATLASATVAIVGNFQSGQDLLGFTSNPATTGNVSASYNSSTGVLTLSSAGATATLAQWQAALQSITYSNSSETPSTSTRTISFVVNDGTDSSSAVTRTVTVAAVNDAPMAVADSVSVAEGGIATTLTGGASSVLANDTDAENDALSALLVTGPAHGTLTLNANGTFSYTHDGSETTTDSFTYKPNDGTADGNPVTVAITVAPVNDAPVNTVPGVQVSAEDTALVFSTGHGNQLAITDMDAGGGQLNATLSVTNGTLTLAGTAGLTFNTGDGTADSTLVFTGTLADINTALSTLTYLPAANYHGGAVLTLTASDGTLTDSDIVDITVSSVNDAPTVAAPIANQNVTEDTGFNFQFAANAFADVDVGDSLTYTAQLAGGAALPTWLSFDAATRTFSGTTLNGDVGTLSVEVTASDGTATVTDTFTLVVANTNDAPTVATSIADQSATEDTAFSFAFASNAFADVDVGDSLTYTAKLASGAALPAWLSFDSVTRTFSGTPLNGDVGTLSIEVTASDGTATVTDTFTLVVANTNDAPTVANAIADASATEDAPFSFQFAADAFADVDVDDSLTYSAQLAGGAALPTWLTFNAATRTFSGTPLNGDVGTLSIDVTASDGTATVTDTFTLVVANTNDAPTVANAIADASATEDAPFTFTVAANAFADVDVGDTLTYTAKLAGGAALPTWLSFDAATRTFSGTPANGNAGTLSIGVIADDSNGGTVTDTFTLVVAAAPPRAGRAYASRHPRRARQRRHPRHGGRPGPRDFRARRVNPRARRRQRRRRQGQRTIGRGLRRLCAQPHGSKQPWQCAAHLHHAGGQQHRRQGHRRREQLAHHQPEPGRRTGTPARRHGNAHWPGLLHDSAGCGQDGRELQLVRGPGPGGEWLLETRQQRHLGEHCQRALRRQDGDGRREAAAGLPH